MVYVIVCPTKHDQTEKNVGFLNELKAISMIMSVSSVLPLMAISSTV